MADLRRGITSEPVPDQQMEQIRDLLFGEFARQSDARIAMIEARYKELEQAVGHRLDAIHARLDALGGQLEAEQRTAFEELSHSVADLADRIRLISTTRGSVAEPLVNGSAGGERRKV